MSSERGTWDIIAGSNVASATIQYSADVGLAMYLEEDKDKIDLQWLVLVTDWSQSSLCLPFCESVIKCTLMRSKSAWSRVQY